MANSKSKQNRKKMQRRIKAKTRAKRARQIVQKLSKKG